MPSRVVWKAARIAGVRLTSTKRAARVEGEYRWWCSPAAIEWLADRVANVPQGGIPTGEAELWKFLECGRPDVRPGEEPVSYEQLAAAVRAST